jgi:hypothetical protein
MLPWQWSHTEQFFAAVTIGGWLIWLMLREIGRTLVAILRCLRNIEEISKKTSDTLEKVEFDTDKIQKDADKTAFFISRIDSNIEKAGKLIDDNLREIKHSLSQIEVDGATAASAIRAGTHGTSFEQDL